MLSNDTSNLDPGDETRHTGDRVGFPHNVADDSPADEATPAPGTPVTFDGDAISTVTGSESDAVAGIVFTYQVYGDTRVGDGPFVRGDRDATVAVRGSYVADLTPYVDGSPDVKEGAALGPHGEVFVLEAVDAGSNLYEVVLR